MSNIQLKLTCHTQNGDDLKLNEKRQLTDGSSEMAEMLELSNKDSEGALIKMLQ